MRLVAVMHLPFTTEQFFTVFCDYNEAFWPAQANRFAGRTKVRGALGLLLIAFALLVYPAWSWLAGHGYPSLPTFGLPCPTTIFTIFTIGLMWNPRP